MAKFILCYFRVFTIVGTLFFFISCAGKTISWNFNDIHSLDVRILDTREWLVKTKLELKDLNKIMRPQLSYYLKKDFRIYEKLDNPYESMKRELSVVTLAQKQRRYNFGTY